jgi:hypothetical protein
MNRRGFFATLAAVALAPFVKPRKPSAQEIVAMIRRKRELAIWEFQQAIIAEMERDFWRPPIRPLGVLGGAAFWVKKGEQP